MSRVGIDFVYLFAGACFVLALKWMSAPTTARRGIRAGELGMLAAVVATLLKTEIVQYQWIVVALLMGGLFVGGDALQISFGLPIAIVNLLQGLIFFFVLGGEALAGYRVVLGRRVARIEPDAGRLVMEDGECLTFSRLVLATGSQPLLPPRTLA